MKKVRDRINVLHLRDSPWVDGPGSTILETAASIDKSRYNYIIGAFVRDLGEGNSLIEAAIKRELNAFPIKESGTFNISVFRQILDYIDKNDVHLIHTHEFRSDLIGVVCAKIKKIPVLTTLHGWIPNGLKGKLFVSLDKLIIRFFDRIIVVSEEMRQQVLKLMISQKKISVLNNAIVIDKYYPDPDDKSFKRELGIDMNTFLIGNIGRLSPEKGQSDFILAACEVLKHHKNIKFIFLGKGPDQQKLEELARNLKIHEFIIFAGYRTTMRKIYNSLDLVVQSSYTEGMPNVVLEASLMEVPVIATKVGGTSEIINNYESGVLIAAGSHEIIAKKIIEYLENQDLYLKMATQAKLRVQQYFNFQNRTKILMNIYEEITQRYKKYCQ